VSHIKVGIISLGCSKNLVDTEVMLGHLDRAGCTFVQDTDDAEVIIVNTCGFIDAAREESVRTILDAAKLKSTGRLKRLVVAGCMVQRYRDELMRELEGEVDAFVGLDELGSIVEASGAGAKTAGHRVAQRASDVRSATKAATGISRRTPVAFISTTPQRRASWPRRRGPRRQDRGGSDHTCSFCAIPSFRGAFRSRPADDVVAEAEALGTARRQEINLIASGLEPLRAGSRRRRRPGGDFSSASTRSPIFGGFESITSIPTPSPIV
jgi:ribosomal protein S12 methylthiotransferase